ncbi:MAG: ornithine cyclodeaminase family protein [Candidatus Caldarchaeum sp.]
MVRVISRTELENWLDMKTSVEIVEDFFREYGDEKYVAPPRMVTPIQERDAVYLNMPAASIYAGGYTVKLINEYRKNPALHGVEAAHGVVLFFDIETGILKGIVDAVALTSLRTGAIGGVGAKYLAPADSRSAALIGSGRTAWTQLTALRIVRGIERVKIYSPTKANREKLAEKASKTLGIDAKAVENPREAVENADVVLTATNSAEPVLLGEWLAENVHVTSIGALPTRRELDLETFRRAELIAADLKKSVLKDAGDIMAAVEKGIVDPAKVLELHEVVKQNLTRPRNVHVTLLKSVGFAALDLYFTSRVLSMAERMGVGRVIEL